MITASDAKKNMELNEPRNRAWEYCKFINEEYIRCASKSGSRYTRLHTRGYPCILKDVDKLTDEDWTKPYKTRECISWEGISEEEWKMVYDFEIEVREWLEKLGYIIERRKLDYEWEDCIVW